MPEATHQPPPSQADPAQWPEDLLKLVTEQQHGVGGSEVGALCGANPFKNVLDVYHKKTRPIPVAPEPDTIHTRRGRLLEPIAADRYTEATGKRVMNVGLRVMQDRPHALVHLDRKVVGEPRGLEAKAPASRSMDWQIRNGIRDEYLIQGQYACAVTGYDACDFALVSLETDPDFITFPVPFDREFGQVLLERVDRFWFQHVVPRIPPDPDAPEWAPLDRVPGVDLSPHLPGEKIPPLTVEPDTTHPLLVQCQEAARWLMERSADQSEARALYEAAKDRMAELMDEVRSKLDVDGLVFPGLGTVYYRVQKGAPRVDVKRLRAAAPLDRDAMIRFLADHGGDLARLEGAIEVAREALGVMVRGGDCDEAELLADVPPDQRARALEILDTTGLVEVVQAAAQSGALDLDVDALVQQPVFRSLRPYPAKRKDG